MLELLAQRCEEERIWLLSDETYAELSFGWPFFTLASCEASQLVVVSSFSKLFSIPGYQNGLCHRPSARGREIGAFLVDAHLMPAAFTQLGCLAGLSVVDQYVTRVKAHCDRVTSACATMVNRSGLLRCASPESGFYLFVDISRTGVDDTAFCKQLLEERHTAVTPGRSFGDDCASFIRIATCGQEHDVVEGVQRVVELARDLGGADVKAA